MELPEWPWIIFTILVIILFRAWLQNRGLPPGPWGLPFIGYYPYVMSDNAKKLFELSKKYGDIYCFRSLGGKLYVILHGMPILKEVFVNSGEEFIGRPLDTNFLNAFDRKFLSMTNMDTEVWREQRRFFQSKIKNFGFGKLEHEELMHEVLEKMFKDIRSYEGKSFDIHTEISNATCNMFSVLLCSKRFPKDDPKYLKFRENTAKMLGVFLDYLFFLGGIFYDIYMGLTPSGNAIGKAVKDMQNFAEEIVDEHDRTFDPNNIRDLIDSYLLHIKTLQREGKPLGSFTRELLKITFMSSFIEGTETTGVTIYLLLLKLSEMEDVQKKIQQEADEIIGHERMPSWPDKPKMPYTEAVLLELNRTTWPFSISTFYCNHKEATIRGYRIPERTSIIFNIWGISNNPEHFPEPSKFDPNRFLGPNAVNWKEKGPIPFGIGKRSCPGEAMAQVEVFIILVAFLQNFTLYPGEPGQIRAVARHKDE